MQKPLEQIQIENRKFILEATGEYKDELKLLEQEHQIYHGIISKSFYSKPLTLSRVLLASIKSAKCMDCHEHKNNKYCNSEWQVDREENLSRIRNFILEKIIIYNIIKKIVYRQKIREFKKRLMITCVFGAGEGN